METPLIPVRILNEYVYCPRLAYLEWVQGEFAENEYTVHGRFQHRRVDEAVGSIPAVPEEGETIHAKSVMLGSERLGIIGKIDLVEGEGKKVIPVDYKRGKRPHMASGAHEPERVQLCAQGLLLRENGFVCEEGAIYFAGSRERSRIMFDEELISRTEHAIQGARSMAEGGRIPPPIEDGQRCPKCSLLPICLPDEVRFLGHVSGEVRPLYPRIEESYPLHIQSAQGRVRKDGERLLVEEEGEEVATARVNEVSQVVLFGSASVTTPVVHELMRRNITLTYMSYGGWFLGHTVGAGHKNVETRIHQYRCAFDPGVCLRLARGFVAAKILNCRTLLRRNRRGAGNGEAPRDGEMGTSLGDEVFRTLRMDAARALRTRSLEELLGVEGTGASRYFQRFTSMFKDGGESGLRFDFTGRNRRPPRDPVNAMLSLAYAMLLREWLVALSAVGLDPYMGFFHQPRFGRPALALDMMEPFRPLIADSTVITAMNNGEVRPSDFISRAGACNLTDSGRRQFIAAFERRLSQEVTHPIFRYRISYRRLFEVQARLLVRHLAGEIPKYPQFTTR